MMKSIHISIFATSLLTLGFFTTVLAQTEKNEIERSVSRSELPAKVVDLIDEFWPDQKGIKYFLETDGDFSTYEVKLNWRGDQYSIEFSTDGNVLDVEKLIFFENIPDSSRNAITRDLDSQFDKYRLTRIQKQFIAADEGEDDSDFIDDIMEEDAEDYEIRYEIELDGENKQELGSFEMLYNESGLLLEKRKMVRRSIDNIW